MTEDSTIVRLAIGRKSETPLLAPHHVAAAVRLEGLIRRALLGPRLTMSYDPAKSGGSQERWKCCGGTQRYRSASSPQAQPLGHEVVDGLLERGLRCVRHEQGLADHRDGANVA